MCLYRKVYQYNNQAALRHPRIEPGWRNALRGGRLQKVL